MIVQTVRTTYPLASGNTVRAGTIGLVFSTAGAYRFLTAAGDDCSGTAVVGQTLWTGLLSTVTTLPASTLGVQGL